MEILYLYLTAVLILLLFNFSRLLWSREKRWKRYVLCLTLSLLGPILMFLENAWDFGTQYLVEPE